MNIPQQELRSYEASLSTHALYVSRPGDNIIRTAHRIHDSASRSDELYELRFHAFAKRIFKYPHHGLTYFSFKQFLHTHWSLEDEEFLEALWERTLLSITKPRNPRPDNPGVSNLLEAFIVRFCHEERTNPEDSYSSHEATKAYLAILASAMKGVLAERTVLQLLEKNGITAILGTDEQEYEDIDLFILTPKRRTLIPVSIKTGRKFDYTPRNAPRNWNSSQELSYLRYKRDRTLPALYMTTNLSHKLPNDSREQFELFSKSRLPRSLNTVSKTLRADTKQQRAFSKELRTAYSHDPDTLELLPRL